MPNNIFFLENGAIYEVMWKKCCSSGRAADNNMAHALYMLDN